MNMKEQRNNVGFYTLRKLFSFKVLSLAVVILSLPKQREGKTFSVPNNAHNCLCVLAELLVIIVSVGLLQQV